MSERINFGTIKEGAEPPNLIELQTNSYKEFLQEGVSPSKRTASRSAGRPKPTETGSET